MKRVIGVRMTREEKSRRERELANDKRMARRFDHPLCLFIQTKYTAIYDEYTNLYKKMNSESPHRKDLLKTKCFKEWMVENSTHKPQTDMVQLYIPQVLLEPCVHPSVQEDILSQTKQGVFAEESGTFQPESIRHEIVQSEASPEDNVKVEESIEDILHELMMPSLRDYLDGVNLNPNDDEGIGLNHFDEITMDIEPFDYELEVEPFDF